VDDVSRFEKAVGPKLQRAIATGWASW